MSAYLIFVAYGGPYRIIIAARKLTDEESVRYTRAFRKTLRNFVAKEIKPNADTWDEVGEIPWDLHQRVGALGVWGFGIEDTVREPR